MANWPRRAPPFWSRMHLEREKLIMRSRGRELWPSRREVAACARSRAREETWARGTTRAGGGSRGALGGVLVAAIRYVSEILVRFTCPYLKSSYGLVWLYTGWAGDGPGSYVPYSYYLDGPWDGP